MTKHPTTMDSGRIMQAIEDLQKKMDDIVEDRRLQDAAIHHSDKLIERLMEKVDGIVKVLDEIKRAHGETMERIGKYDREITQMDGRIKKMEEKECNRCFDVKKELQEKIDEIKTEFKSNKEKISSRTWQIWIIVIGLIVGQVGIYIVSKLT